MFCLCFLTPVHFGVVLFMLTALNSLCDNDFSDPGSRLKLLPGSPD